MTEIGKERIIPILTKTPSPAVQYYFDYLGFLHKLISNNILSPYWLNMDNIITIAKRSSIVSTDLKVLSERFSTFKNNRYLIGAKDNPYLLAEDILKNGCYVPMLSQNNNERFCNGSHRIGTLIAYHQNIKPITKNFLCLCFNDDVKKEYNTNSLNGLELKIIFNGGTHIALPENNKDISDLFDTNGGMAANLAFDYNRRIQQEKLDKKLIIPAPCLNDRKKFDDFILNPFTDNYLSIINDIYGLYLPFQHYKSIPEVSFYLTEEESKLYQG